MYHQIFKSLFIIVCLSVFFAGCEVSTKQKRREISLNGQWQIAKTEVGVDMPKSFSSSCPVPGLVDRATPTLDVQDTAYENSVYWYKRKFTVENAERIQLKINKAKYHTKVFVNSAFVGENLYNFTPGYFDIKPFLEIGKENELVISVSCENNMPDTVMTGHDFEKMKYIPGIYDDVKIIASGYPFISNVQTVPNIEDGKVKIVAKIETLSSEKSVELSYKILETASKKVVGKGTIHSEKSDKNGELNFEAAIENVNLWTPENPFLYTLELETSGDNYFTRFGMRTFTANPDGTAFLLNGKPYFMRGTNVCILRFFEDPNRAGLPWYEDWAIKVHQRFKEMNWNSIRYCIGFPPERWYDIADSLGFLIQDEYPIWTLGQTEEIYPNVSAEHLANEFGSWLPERWNHPCVVIWDAQNESVAPITTDAIKMVRHMDLSNRLWENGWSEPADRNDPYESHPYLFSKFWHEGEPSEKGPMADFLNEVRKPHNDVNNHLPDKQTNPYTNPIIINEYAWLWLNRNGTTTTLTDRVYDVCFGENLTSEERIENYTRHLGMLTEYWRAHRFCAGVLHFCGLGYSRPEEPRGQTSDHFIDIKNLTYEPHFVEHVKPAFAPVGLMINFWELNLTKGIKKEFEIYAINDLDTTYTGELKLSMKMGGQIIFSKSYEMSIDAYGRTITRSIIEMPTEPGEYQLTAEIELNGELVKSIRKFQLK